MRTILRLLIPLFIVLPALAQDTRPLDDGILVNGETSAGQRRPAVASNRDGGFFAVWESDVSVGTDSDGTSLQGRHFDSAGAPLSGDFQINLQGTYNQRFPDVVRRPDDGFLVVWDSGVFVSGGGGDGWGAAVRGLRLDSAGAPQGGEFQVNTYTFYEQRYPRVAMNGLGDFVVVWQSRLSTTTPGAVEEIRAQRYGSSGTTLGGEIVVNTWTTDDQTFPAVAIGTDGGFVVVWESDGSPGDDNDGLSIQGRRFASGGTALSEQFQINVTAATSQTRPDVGMLPDGGFAVVWTGFGSGCCLQLRRYDSVGTPLAGEESLGSGSFVLPRLRMSDEDGTFLVVWGGANGQQAIAGRRFTVTGQPLGAEFAISPESVENQTAGTLAGDPRGRFVVAWQRGTAGQSASYDVWARRFVVPLFDDGFESGDVSAWTVASP